jgi:hypothetical protein
MLSNAELGGQLDLSTPQRTSQFPQRHLLSYQLARTAIDSITPLARQLSQLFRQCLTHKSPSLFALRRRGFDPQEVPIEPRISRLN